MHFKILIFIEVVVWLVLVRRVLLRREYPHGLTGRQFWVMFLCDGIALAIIGFTAFAEISIVLALLLFVTLIVLVMLVETWSRRIGVPVVERVIRFIKPPHH